MLEELNAEEMENYLEENPRIVPKFDIDVIETVGAYTMPAIAGDDNYKPDTDALIELRRA